MSSPEFDLKEWFHKSYKPIWKLHQFAHPIWLVDFSFDDSGPTESEFETAFKFTGEYLGLAQQEFAERMLECAGFSTGQPFTLAQVRELQQARMRISSTEIPAGQRFIYTGTRYFIVEDSELRNELADWMLGQGAEIEIKTIE
jgi:hypothetical protein